MSEDEMVRHINYRVVVHPYEDKDNRECLRLKAEIECHVDDYSFVEIVSDTVCAACGELWEQLPCCCDEAVRRFEQKNPQWSQDENGRWHFHLLSEAG